MQNFDVIVIGGGPAGAASALKSSQLGFKTVLVEKGPSDRHKPCGGVFPDICIDILHNLELKIPTEVMCSPPTIGLFYVPPSGRSNGGSVRNYRLLNVNRDRFDEWLRKAAEISGSTILHEAEFVRFEKKGKTKFIIRLGGKLVELSARYLIGADGAFSAVRRQLYPDARMDYLQILQEHWSAGGDFDEYFYVFFNGNVTPAYSYLIPKNGRVIVGTGVPPGYRMSVSDCLPRFKDWLRREFSFNPTRLVQREATAIPYSSPLCGEGNAVLVGDAAGFCNHMSGEGVRLAIESGMAACEALVEAERGRETLSSLYTLQVQSLVGFIENTHEYAVGMTDDDREQFVKSELARMSL